MKSLSLAFQPVSFVGRRSGTPTVSTHLPDPQWGRTTQIAYSITCVDKNRGEKSTVLEYRLPKYDQMQENSRQEFQYVCFYRYVPYLACETSFPTRRGYIVFFLNKFTPMKKILFKEILNKYMRGGGKDMEKIMRRLQMTEVWYPEQRSSILGAH